MKLEDKDFIRIEGETEEEFQIRICSLKENKGLYWDEIAQIINNELGTRFTESKFRRQYGSYVKLNNPTLRSRPIPKGYEKLVSEVEEFVDIEKEKINFRDMRNSLYNNLRKEARIEANKEIAMSIAEQMKNEKPLTFSNDVEIEIQALKSRRKGILCISDWHYGIEFSNFINSFSPEIAVQRIKLLTDKVIEYGTSSGVTELHVTNLGDMIAGAIHLQIRLESRENVIEQTMRVSELIAEMLNRLSEHFKVYYYDCLDNHSRIDAKKASSVTMESFALFIPWYLKTRLEGNKNIVIEEPQLDNDLISFEVMGHKVIGAHGHKDSPKNIVSALTCLTKQHYDLALIGHRHHFEVTEQYETLVVHNGALVGTDEYAKDLRLSSKPTQNLIIVSEDNPCECLYRIVLG